MAKPVVNKSIALNSVFNFALKFTRIMIPLFVTSYVQRLLDKELFGIHNYAVTWINIAIIFGSFGIGTYGLRELAAVRDDRERARRLFSSLFTISLVTNLLSFGVYLLLSMYSMEGISQTIFILAGFKIFANAFLVEWFNEAYENYRFITIKTLIVQLMYAVLLMAFVRQPEDIIPYCLLVSATDLVNNFISFVYVNRQMPLRFRDLEIKRHLVLLLPILFISNANYLYAQADKLMLGTFVNEVSVTVYNTPQTITYSISQLIASVALVAVPRLSYYLNNDQEENYNRLLQKSYHSFMLMIFPACIGIAVLAPEIMWVFGGGKYDESIPVLVLFAIRTIESAVYIVCANQVLYLKNQERFLVRALLLFGILNVSLNGLLIALGAFMPTTAIATTFAAEILLTATLFWYIQKKLGVPLYFFSRENIKYAGFSLPIFLIAWAIKKIDFAVLLPDGIGPLDGVSVAYVLRLLLIIGICMAFYFGALLIVKDETMLFLTNKVLGRFRRKHKA